MKGGLQLLLSTVLATAHSGEHQSLAAQAKNDDARTVVINSHADAEVEHQTTHQATSNSQRQTVVINSHAEAELSPDTDSSPEAVETGALAHPRLMRGEKHTVLDVSLLADVPEEEGCKDDIGEEECLSKKSDCDKPVLRLLMVKNCKVTCGICRPIARIKCEWSTWERWSRCDESCGTGVQFRRRSVQSVAQNGGDECPGSSQETQSCNQEACPTSTTVASQAAVQPEVAVESAKVDSSAKEKKKSKVHIYALVALAVLAGIGLFIVLGSQQQSKMNPMRVRGRTDTGHSEFGAAIEDDNANTDQYYEDYDEYDVSTYK